MRTAGCPNRLGACAAAIPGLSGVAAGTATWPFDFAIAAARAGFCSGRVLGLGSAGHGENQQTVGFGYGAEDVGGSVLSSLHLQSSIKIRGLNELNVLVPSIKSVMEKITY